MDFEVSMYGFGFMLANNTSVPPAGLYNQLPCRTKTHPWSKIRLSTCVCVCVCVRGSHALH